jgi:hypothetical protein
MSRIEPSPRQERDAPRTRRSECCGAPQMQDRGWPQEVRAGPRPATAVIGHWSFIGHWTHDNPTQILAGFKPDYLSTFFRPHTQLHHLIPTTQRPNHQESLLDTASIMRVHLHLHLSASHERHPVDLPKLPSPQTPLHTRRNRLGDTIMLTRFQHTTCSLECLLRGAIPAMEQETLVENAFSHGLRTWRPV